VDAQDNADFITLARIVKTQGRLGEVAAEIHSDVPDRFAVGMKLFGWQSAGSAKQVLGQKKGPERFPLEIEDLWPHKGLLVLKFRGIDSISAAEVLLGSELQVPRAERAELEPGWSYISDLIGCTVFDQGKEIGRIEDVHSGAGEAPLLIVADHAGEKWEVPFAEAYLEDVDVKRREVRMKLPEGMLEVNAPMTAEEKQQQSTMETRRALRSRR
jgi:16S rRNA processing protein RimM